ncbi:addiction module protein [Wenyingzhuangia sp. IMCC45574]
MDLSARKYHFIQELLTVNEEVMDSLEAVLKRAQEEKEELSQETKDLLDSRLASYHKNPEDVLDWEDVKKSW